MSTDATLKLMESERQSRIPLPMKSGGAAAEKRYGQLYQRLVRQGAEPQIRRKYRGE